MFPLAAIELGSIWMLGWLAAAGIPLALHLLHRRRQQEIHWAAMELLMQAIQQNSRTVRIEGWLLLLLRTLALILLAIALARPLLSGNTNVDATLTEPPRLWAIVLDASYSMNYSAGRQTLWQQAQSQATDLVRQASPRDAFVLMQMSDPPQAVIGQPVFDAARVISEISRLKCTDAGARLSSSLELVQQTLEDAQQSLADESTVEIIFFSDMGRDTWQAAIEGDARSTLQQLSSRYAVRYQSLAVEQPVNVAITAFEADAPLILAGRSLQCSATIRNFGSEPVLRMPVQFLSEGSTIQTEFVDCPAGQARTVSTQMQPPSDRTWHISALLPDDALLPDNRRDLIISVRPQVRVVTIEPTAGAARMINLSLAPASSAEMASNLKRRAATVETWSTSQLPARNLDQVDAVILVDVPQLDPASLIKLREYVAGGGAVLALVGPRTDAVAWNRATDSLGQLLGIQLDSPSAPGDWQVDPLGYESPLAKPFANYLDAGLLTTPIFRYWKIKSPEPTSDPTNPGTNSETPGGRVVVDLALSSGDPWIVRRSIGAGWMAVMLSAPESGGALDRSEPSWNAIATWPSFVPIMQKLIETLIGGGDAQNNLLVGQPLRGWLAHSSQSTELIIHRPDQSQSRLTVPAADGNSRPAWVYTQVDRAGVYDVTTAANPSEPGAQSDQQLFAVNIEPNQSAMQAVNIESLPVGKPAGSQPSSTSRSSGSEVRPSEFLTKASLWLLLCVLAMESLLAWHLGRRLA